MVSALFASNARFHLWLGNWIPHAAWHDSSQKKKKKAEEWAEVLNRVGVHLRGGWGGGGGTDLAVPPCQLTPICPTPSSP